MFALVLMLPGAIYCGGEKDEVMAQVKKMAQEKLPGSCELGSVEVVTGAIKDDSNESAVKPAGAIEEDSGNAAEAEAGEVEVAYTAKVTFNCYDKITLVAEIKRNKKTGELDYTELKDMLNMFSN